MTSIADESGAEAPPPARRMPGSQPVTGVPGARAGLRNAAPQGPARPSRRQAHRSAVGEGRVAAGHSAPAALGLGVCGRGRDCADRRSRIFCRGPGRGRDTEGHAPRRPPPRLVNGGQWSAAAGGGAGIERSRSHGPKLVAAMVY